MVGLFQWSHGLLLSIVTKGPTTAPSKLLSSHEARASLVLKTMILNETQAKALQLVANAELRTPEQMLSLLLAEGIRFYFCDYESPFSHVDLDADAVERVLRADAMRCAQG